MEMNDLTKDDIKRIALRQGCFDINSRYRERPIGIIITQLREERFFTHFVDLGIVEGRGKVNILSFKVNADYE